MVSCKLSIHLIATPALTGALANIEGAIVQTGRPLFAESLEGVLKRLELGCDFIRAVPADFDVLPASGTRNLRTLLEPTDALLELAMASGTGEFDLGIEHGEAP